MNSPEHILQASGGEKLPHTCTRHPEDTTLGEGCPGLTQCVQALHPLGPCTLVRFRLQPDGSTFLPFATGNFQAVQLLPWESIRQDTTPLFSLVHPDDFDRVAITMAQSARSLSPWREEYRILHPATGELRWLRSCLVPQREPSGDIVGYGLIANVTAARNSRSALLELCEHAPIGVFRTTLEGRYLSVNQHFANICGYHSPQELRARCHDISTQLYTHPGERETVIRLVRAHGAIERYALELQAKDGETRWISLNIRAVLDAAGRMEGLEGFCADITDEVRQGLTAGRCTEFAHTSFGFGQGGSKNAEKPAGNNPDGLCHLVTYVRDAILWRLGMSSLR